MVPGWRFIQFSVSTVAPGYKAETNPAWQQAGSCHQPPEIEHKIGLRFSNISPEVNNPSLRWNLLVETTYQILSCPASIALLADFHNGDPEPVLLSLYEHRPDLIAIAGDLIYGSQPRSPAPDTEPELVLKSQVNVLPWPRSIRMIWPKWSISKEPEDNVVAAGVYCLFRRVAEFFVRLIFSMAGRCAILTIRVSRIKRWQ